jgi:hypothetical protein
VSAAATNQRRQGVAERKMVMRLDTERLASTEVSDGEWGGAPAPFLQDVECYAWNIASPPTTELAQSVMEYRWWSILVPVDTDISTEDHITAIRGQDGVSILELFILRVRSVSWRMSHLLVAAEESRAETRG